MLTTLLLAATQVTSIPAVPDRPVATPRQNLVLIVADDFGVDLVRGYGESMNPPCTPNIDGLAAEGLLFRNAWANPACTPTRAALLTGRHGFRTGVGTPGPNTSLPLSETTLPEMLTGYASSCIGKWHIGPGNSAPNYPNDSGFDHYAGNLNGAVPNYFSWRKTVNGSSSNTTNYLTTDTVDDAIAAMQSMPEPWLLYVALNAPHSPFHVPPVAACGPAVCGSTWCGNLPSNPTDLQMGKAMVEAMDNEMGRLLTALETEDPNAMIVFMGDNGSPRQLSEGAFLASHAKGTVYEGGVNVPFIVKGPGVVVGECHGLVHCVDIFATFAALGGVRGPLPEDTVSMLPYFRDPTTSVREFVYAETFSPNATSFPFTQHRRAVRSGRYKLLRENGQQDEMYDLDIDPFETNNLLPNLNATELAAFDALEAEFARLGVQ